MALSPNLAAVVGAAVDAGPYLNAWKAIVPLVVLLAWGRFITWADKDAPPIHLPRMVTNLILMVTAVLGFLLFLMLPGFLVASLVLVLCVVAGMGTYLGMRAQKHGLSDLSDIFVNWVRSLGSKPKIVREIEDELQVADRSGNLMPPPPDDAPERAGYDAMQRLLAPALKRNAERIELTPAAEGARLVYAVDGVAYTGGTATKDIAGSTIAYLKQCAGLNLEERRKPQTGKLKTVFNHRKKELQITTMGSSAGETMVLEADVRKRHDKKLDALGLFPEQEEAIRESIRDNTGVVIAAAPKGQGLTTTMYAILRAHDAFLTHIMTVERAADQDLEGITQKSMPAGASPAEEFKEVSWAFSQEADVVAITSMEEPNSAKTASQYAGTGKRVYVGMRASDVATALAQWRRWLGNDEAALAEVRMLIASRLVRRLCPACKVAIVPDPNQLRKLNMDPAKVTQLFQARTDPLRDAKGNPIVCETCNDLHYVGRIGVFEILKVDDDVRAAVAAGGTAKQLHQAFRKQKSPTIQEAALAQVQAGETSVQEVLRVLRAEEPAKK